MPAPISTRNIMDGAHGTPEENYSGINRLFGIRDQYSSASMIVIMRWVIVGSAGSSEW